MDYRNQTLGCGLAAIVLLGCCSATAMAAASDAKARSGQPRIDVQRDLISLHYDHAPDKDDGHSAAADRMVLQTLFGVAWMKEHVVAVSGAYGKNARQFNDASDAVMDAAFGDVGGWIDAHEDRTSAVDKLADRWRAVLEAGGDVWVKEGGQSDITADVVRRLRKTLPDVDFKKRIHVVQHSTWNENQTTDRDLEFVKQSTHYIRIKDANRYLNRRGGDRAFEQAATSHPVFGKAWQAAFHYYNPRHRLDFSDTGELFYMLGLGEMGIDAVRRRFLESNPEPGQR